MISGIESILFWYRNSGRPFWKLYGKGSDLVADYYNSGASDSPLVESGAEDSLIETLELLDPGRYTLEVMYKTDSTATKNRLKTIINLGAAGKNVAVAGGAPSTVGMLTAEQVQAQITQALEAYQAKLETERLREQVRELQAKVEEGSPIQLAIAKLIEATSPFAGPAAGKWLKQQFTEAGVVAAGAAVSGASPDGSEVDETERMGKALESLGGKIPDLTSKLEMLAALPAETLNKLLEYL